MERQTFKHPFARRLLALLWLLPVTATLSWADEPRPAFAYDFAKASNGIVSAGGNKALDLRAEGRRDGVLTGRNAVLPAHPEEASRWLAKATPDEFSAAFWIRFDRLPSEGKPFGLFDISADREGFVTIRLFAKPGEFQGDYVMRSSTPVRRGHWHHVEFTYSKIQWRASLYLDGRFQWENDNLNLPSLRYGPLVLVDGFRGALRDVRFYDMALPSEALAIADETTGDPVALGARAKELSARTANVHLKGWLSGLSRKAEELAADRPHVTIHQIRELEEDLGNAEKIVDGFARTKGLPAPMTASPVALYTVRPLTQELFLPRTIPENGELSGRMQIVATRGEYENGSALVFAFKPIEIRKVSVSDLRGPGGKVIPSKEVDVKIVKRWFRTGGAWLSYHTDRRQRNLTPDLLVYDDKLIKVDEWRRRNYLRLDYPEGSYYEDVSDPAKGHIPWGNDIPFRDAETLQPVTIGEAGRNQQFLFTIHVPKDAADGIYRGRIAFDGTGASLELVVRVLPFDLPTQPSTYYDLDKTFLSHVNSLPPPEGKTVEDRERFMKKLLAHVRSHNAFHMTGLWDSEELINLSRAAGLQQDKIFGVAGGHRFAGLVYDWLAFYPGVPESELTSDDKKKAVEIIHRMARPWQTYFKKHFPAEAEPYVIFFSENSAFNELNTIQGEESEIARSLGQKVFAHGWYANSDFAGDIQDMQSITYLDDEKEAREWHSVGGELISYSDTFPGNENPYWFRRRIGLRTYKAGYDGEMLHGFIAQRIPWNEFSPDPGGDGNYRNARMLLPQQDGFLSKLAFEGYREAFDDLRYATRMRQLALANLDSRDNDLRRECRRQLLWLENIDGKTADLEMVRVTLIDNLCLLQDLIKERKGILPPPDKVAAR